VPCVTAWFMRSFPTAGKLAAEKVLVSVGRTMNTENIGIEQLGVEKGKRARSS